jgi:hypothetical protein
MTHRLTLELLPDGFAVCRLASTEAVPAWAVRGPLASVTRTQTELSILCLDSAVPDGVTAQRGWRGLRVVGPLDFALVGVLAALVVPLAEAGVSLFAFSTFDTDYILVRAADLDRAVSALRGAGHTVAE